jgi:hypothetical protein
MKFIKNEYFEIGLKKSKQWTWKPSPENTLHNYHKLVNGKGFKFVNTRSYFVPILIRIFWLNILFYMELKPKMISGYKPIRYVKYEDTHLELMDLPQGNWDDNKIK